MSNLITGLVFRNKEEMYLATEVLVMQGGKIFFKDWVNAAFKNAISKKLLDCKCMVIADENGMICWTSAYGIKYKLPDDVVIDDELRMMVKLGHNPFTELVIQ